jgi:hypothetical protein
MVPELPDDRTQQTGHSFDRRYYCHCSKFAVQPHRHRKILSSMNNFDWSCGVPTPTGEVILIGKKMVILLSLV